MYVRACVLIQVRVFDLQGWLGKEGGSIKTWKKRWCVLEKGTLYYFKSPDVRDQTQCPLLVHAVMRK